VSAAFLCWFLGVAVIYATLFGNGLSAVMEDAARNRLLVGLQAAAWGLFRTLPRVASRRLGVGAMLPRFRACTSMMTDSISF